MNTLFYKNLIQESYLVCKMFYEALLGISLCPLSEFRNCLCHNIGDSLCRSQNFSVHFTFSFVAVVISRWRSCSSLSFQFLYIAVSEPCRLSEFYPNRVSSILLTKYIPLINCNSNDVDSYHICDQVLTCFSYHLNRVFKREGRLNSATIFREFSN